MQMLSNPTEVALFQKKKGSKKTNKKLLAISLK
jgi:hypothetical protein